MKRSELLRLQSDAVLVRLGVWRHRNSYSSKLGCLCLLLENLNGYEKQRYGVTSNGVMD